MMKFECVFEDEAPKSLSFELQGGEKLSVEQEGGSPFLHANRRGCAVLAEIFAKLALGDYENGFHLHLQRDFETDGGQDVLTILLNEE